MYRYVDIMGGEYVDVDVVCKYVHNVNIVCRYVDIIYLVSVVTVWAAAEQSLGVQLRRVQLGVGRVLSLAPGFCGD